MDLLAGDPVAAERSLRGGYSALEEMGDRAELATTAAFLAQALLAQGRDEDAERFAELSADLAAADDLITQVLWRGVRARIVAGRGHTGEGERLAQEAVDLAARSDFVNDMGDALIDLAIVQRQAGRLGQAGATLAEGLRLYEEKGNVVAAGRARAQLADLANV